MTVALEENNKHRIVHPSEMRDGEIGVIVKWEPDNYIGRIVQRYNDILITIGEPTGKAFPDICRYSTGTTSSCKVRILEKGEKIVIQ